LTTDLHSRTGAASPSADRADRLFAAALAIVSARTVDEMLRETTVRAAEIIGAHQALTVLTVNGDWTTAITSTHLSARYAGYHDVPPAGTVPPDLAGIHAEVARSNTPQRMTEADLERRLNRRAGAARADDEAAIAPPLRGLLAVPLVGRAGLNLGLIQLSDRHEGEFDAADEQLLTSLAGFTAMAIEQLRLHADLAYQSGLTRTVAENATSGLFLMDPRGNVTYMNSAGARVIGHDLASLGDRTLHEVIHHSRPDGTPLPMDACRIWRTVLGDERALGPFEDSFVRPDGTFYPVRVAAAPVHRDGRVVGVVLEVQDISAEQVVAGRLSDLAISASDRAAKLRGLIQSIGDAVVVCEPDGPVSLLNPAAIEMFGPRLSHVSQLIARLRNQDGGPVDPDAPIAGSYLLQGTERETWVEARAFPVPVSGPSGRADARTDDRPDPRPETPPDPAAPAGEPPADHGRIYVFRDVTGSRRAKVLRETFIGMLSHELRTPITTVYGGTKVLARRAETLAPEVRSIVADIEAESERLFRLVEDLVVLTKSEASSLDAGREPVLLQRMLPRLVTAEARRWPTLAFSVECWASLAPVLAEQTYVEQVVRNLLTNAAKYGGSAGTIDVLGYGEGDEVIVRVLDRGPGFPEGDAARLFDIYYRSPQVARRAAGAGIGLFVCKSLVEAMGGRIWAREREGGGAEFGFALKAMVEPTEADEA
jgi:PAS domain S-box-containing protein